MNFKKILFTLVLTSVLAFSFSYADNVDGPDIFLKSNLKSVDAGEVVKVTVTFSEPVVKFTRDMVGVDGGTLESVRKLSSVSYLLFIRAQDKNKYVDVQVEADIVQNTSKVSNAYASNELYIKINPAPVAAVPTDSTNNTLSNILDQLQQTASQNAQNTQVIQQQAAQTPQASYVNCYGTMIPSTQTCTNPNVLNTNQYNPYQTQQQPVYDPYTGTYYYPQPTTQPMQPVVNPYAPSVYNPYGISPYNNYNTYGTYGGTNSYYDSSTGDTYTVYDEPAPVKKTNYFNNWFGW